MKRTLLKPNESFMILNLCSTLQRTDDLRCSISHSQSIALSDNFGRRLIRKSILLRCSSFLISLRFSMPLYPLSPYSNSSFSCSSLCVSLISWTFADLTVIICTSPLLVSIPTWHFIPNFHSFSFLVRCISEARFFSAFGVELGALMIVASTIEAPCRSTTHFHGFCSWPHPSTTIYHEYHYGESTFSSLNGAFRRKAEYEYV